MRRARRLAGVVAAALVIIAAAALLVACDSIPNNPPLGPSPTVSPNAGPTTAADGETPEHAARRLFPEAYAAELAAADSPEILEGVRPGPPVPISADYSSDANLAQWVLPNAAEAVTGNMFAAMWPSAMKSDAFFVPMIKDGRSVYQYSVELRGGGWVGAYPQVSQLPSGSIRQLEAATAQLKAMLGEGTEVRPVIFLPSGMAFAVGDNQGREAAAYIGWSNLGPGIEEVQTNEKYDPRYGDVFTPAQLKEMLTP